MDDVARAAVAKARSSPGQVQKGGPGELLREQMDDVARAAVAKARRSPGQVQKGGAGSTNLQAGGDIRIDGRLRRRG